MTAIANQAARWWHLADNGKVVCTLCPRLCHIPNGSRGFCFVRANVDNKLELTTYGRSSGFCIDPVEKKPLNHFLPGTPTLSFGTAGCNLGCKFCQNWDISKSREMDTLAQIATPEAIVAAALRTDCRSLSFTYNDPVIWAEYAIDIAKVARQHGIKTIAVTAGYIDPEARREFYSHMDAANVDLKGFTENFYDRLCQSKLAPVLDTLKFLKNETNVWFELTNLMIPGENDSESETKEMCDWIVDSIGPDVPIHFTAFHPDFKMRETPATPPRTLVRAREIARAAGIRYAYVGNVNDVENQSTYCHACGELLIQRDWYKLGIYQLRGGNCAKCGTKIPGVFDDKGPGTWGPKRQRVIIGEETMQETKTAPAKLSTEFSAAQDAEILAYTRAVIEATLLSQPYFKAKLPEELAKAASYGVFVSLFRGEQLRSCKGVLGEIRPLGEQLAACARDALSQDPRFPRVTPAELSYLTVEVSFLQPPETLAARGEDRVGAVKVGTHGLIIAHPRGQGLLLPHVATEQNWDARTFLEQICRKANLPAGTWREDSATLMTFTARKIESPPEIAGVSPQLIAQSGFSQLAAVAEKVVRGEVVNLPPASADSVIHRVNAGVHGICLRSVSGVTGLAISPGQSLLQLAASAAQSLAVQLKQRGNVEPLQDMLLLWQPLPLVAADYPGRHSQLAGAAVLAQNGGQWTLQLALPGTDPIAGALNGIKLAHRQWLEDRSGAVQLMAFNTFQVRMQPAAVEQVRTPACAGSFYPGDAAAIAQEVDQYLAAGGYKQIAPQKFRAIMLPHAGWKFCGSTMGKTLAGVSIPRTVIIVGPRHTPAGAPCSAAGHSAWQIPGATIPVATEIAQRLSRAVPGLALEGDAHRQEHGSEVIVPFLHRMRPDVRIVPIVLGQCSQETILALARELAAIASEAEPPLLIISSDMNHFASDAENRRLDGLALDAMQTGDPQKLFDTCTQIQISMCGVIPAATVMLALKALTPAIAPRIIDYATSAAASGDYSRVVGYAGVVIA